MKVTYLNHSGFLLELEDCYIIFDYYRGELPPLNQKKEVFVFCSHAHGDHYNPKIFSLLNAQGMSYQAVLASDIRDKKRLSEIKHSFVEPDKNYLLDQGIQLETLLSNDSGVAFILKIIGGSARFITGRLGESRADILTLPSFPLIRDWKLIMLTELCISLKMWIAMLYFRCITGEILL